MCRDILYHLGFDATKKNKDILHDFHKWVLRYETTAGLSHEALSLFTLEVTLYWAEKGIFVRTSKKQPLGIENMELSKVWNVL